MGKRPQIWLKTGNSPVTEADLAADKYLKDVLLTARPDYGWISEETLDERVDFTKATLFRCRSDRWNPCLYRRCLMFGASVSPSLRIGRPVAGVLECPARHETIHVPCRVEGADQNGSPIRAQAESRPFKVAATGRISRISCPSHFLALLNALPHVASLAYRLAMVARGDIAGTFVRPNSHDWDLAAADLILVGSGRQCLDSRRQSTHLRSAQYSAEAITGTALWLRQVVY